MAAGCDDRDELPPHPAPRRMSPEEAAALNERYAEARKAWKAAHPDRLRTDLQS